MIFEMNYLKIKTNFENIPRCGAKINQISDSVSFSNSNISLEFSQANIITREFIVLYCPTLK